MTGYDPFSYGQVKLGEGKPAAGTSPDDILFAESGQNRKKAPAPAADSSWELLEADVESLLPSASASATQVADFGSDILGESAPEPVAALPAAPRARPRPAAEPRGARANEPAPAVGQPVAGPARRTVGSRNAAPAAPVEAGEGVAVETRKQATPRPLVRAPGARAGRLSGILVPTLLFAGGGIGAAWLYGMEQNLVMAGMVGALSFVAAAFAWVWMRG